MKMDEDTRQASTAIVRAIQGELLCLSTPEQQVYVLKVVREVINQALDQTPPPVTRH